MSKLPKRKAFSFYSSYDDAFEQLDELQQVKLFKAIRDVEFFRKHIDKIVFKDKILMFAWSIIKHSVDSQILGYCRANKVNYNSMFKVAKVDTPRVVCESTLKEVQEKEQEKEQVQQVGNYTKLLTTNPLLYEVSFLEWMNHKKFKTKAPITKCINFLTRFDKETQKQIIDSSIMNGWKGLFEPKQQQSKQFVTKDQQNRANIDRYAEMFGDAPKKDFDIVEECLVING